MDRKFLREVRTLTAVACLHFERQAWSKLEADLAAQACHGSARLLLYLECVSHDGVDLWLESKSVSNTGVSLAASGLGAPQAAGSNVS